MKTPSAHSQTDSKHPENHQAADEEWDATDPVWQLLGEAKQPTVDPFFARNIVRAARQMEQEKPSLAERLAGIFSGPRIAIATLSCAAVLAIVWQVTPSATTQPSAPSLAQQSPAAATESVETESTYLADLMMAETLSAAAEDPSIFTRDEVVAMLGL